MIPCWRWFGPQDAVTLPMVAQAGATGIVTALHEVPAGAPWSADAIAARKAEIEGAGLTWEVCESIWMSDALILGDLDARAAWKDTLAHLGRAGVKTVCYNFMPVLDWTRTELEHPLPSGRALRFDPVDLAVYDIHILERDGAAEGHDGAFLTRVADRFAAMDTAARARLEATVISGLPGGNAGMGRETFRARLAAFGGMKSSDMRESLAEFLADVVPVAEEFGTRLAIHPDDPPFPLFGLPRIVSTEDDLAAILDMEPSRANGLTLCTGSLGARADNDLPRMAERFADRIAFAHLRNVRLEEGGAFHEAEHLGGSVDMIAVLDVLRRRTRGLPMRPDHGHLLEYERLAGASGGAPGYSYLGRLKGLAELRGALMALEAA